MTTIAKKFKDKFTKKVFACPNCSKQLRVPIKPGKVLMVTCSRCSGQIQLSFKSPLSELFSWEKGRPFSYNFRMFRWRLKGLPTQFKISLLLQMVIMIWMVQLLAGMLMAPKTPSVEPMAPKADYVRKI